MAASFRTRLTLWNLAILTCAMLLLGGLMAFATQRLTLESIDRELYSRVEPMLLAAHENGPRGGGSGQNQNPNPAQGQGQGQNQEPGFGSGSNLPNNPDQLQLFNPNDPNQRRPGNWLNRLRQQPIPRNLDEDAIKILVLRRPRILSVKGTPLFDPEPVEPWDIQAFRTALTGKQSYKTIYENNENIRIFSSPIRRQNEIVAVVQVASDLAPLAAIKSSQIILLAILIPAVLLLASMGAAFLTRRALKPIENLTAAAHSLSARDLSQRIPTQGDDEFTQLAEEFNGMIARLQSSFNEKETLLQAQKQFTADASHELRTPLTRIKIITSSAEEDPEIDPESRDRFRTIQTATDHMTALVEQMLILARTENLKENPNLEAYSLTSVIARAVELANLNQDPRLKLELKDKHALINPPMLERAILNLLTNAARHTPESGTITLKTEEQNGQIAITITDSGEGIAPEHLGKLTNRFYRVDSARNQATGGTGLGLSIVDSIVKAHGGILKIESQPNQGTRATITVKKS
ncbi:MAG: sensor histidine kinase [Fimbriimonadaceae bacterium]